MTITARSEIVAEGLPMLGRGTDGNPAALNAQGRNAEDAAGAEAAVSFRTRWQAQFASLDGSEAETGEGLAGAGAGRVGNDAGKPAVSPGLVKPGWTMPGLAANPSFRPLDQKAGTRAVAVSLPGAGAAIVPDPEPPATGSKATGKTSQAGSASSTDKPKLPRKDTAIADLGAIGAFPGVVPPACPAAAPVAQSIVAPTLMKARPGVAGPEQEQAAGQAASGVKVEGDTTGGAQEVEARPVSQLGVQDAGQAVKSEGRDGQIGPTDQLNQAQLSASAGLAAASQAVAISAPALAGGIAALNLPTTAGLSAVHSAPGTAKSGTSPHAGRDPGVQQKAKPAAHAAASVDSPLPASAVIAGSDNPAAGVHDASARVKTEATASTHSFHETSHTASPGLDGSARLGSPVVVQTSASSAAAGAGRSALRETFSALDADSGAVSPTWTHAAPQQAEAGFKDPALGWVGVRADTSGGGVHAVLVPGSAKAAEELGRHMDGIHTYMAEQHTPIDSLGMDAPGGMGSGMAGGRGPMPVSHSGMDQAGDSGSNSGSGQNGQQQSDSGNGSGGDQTAAGQAGTDRNGSNQGGPDPNSRQGWTEPVGQSHSVAASVPEAASGSGLEADGLAWQSGNRISLVA